MKSRCSVGVLFGLAAATGCFGAPVQTTNDVQQRALEVLRQTMEGMQSKPLPPKRPATPGPRQPTFAEVEQLYLQGKITAKEFQKYLEEHKLDPAQLRSAGPQTPGVDTARNPSARTTPNQTNPTAPAPNPEGLPGKDKPVPGPNSSAALTNSATTPDQPGLSELEKKMDELLRLKAARENTNLPNAATNNANAPAPKTKRERLDALLKLYIDGKLSDAEYKEKRAKLISEPD